MRSPLSGVGPLTEFIQESLGLSHSMIGLLTTLPLLCFAGLSGFILYFTQRWGLESTIAGALVILTIGTSMRAIAYIPSLYLGTLFIGIGIAVVNVLLPSITKRDFPENSGAMTSMYSGFMGIGATLGAGLSVPLAMATNWQFSLGIWALIPFIGFLLWIPQLKNRTMPKAPVHILKSFKILGSSATAWQIAFFMGLQSFIFYAVLAWLPEMLIERGMTAAKAGWMLSISQGTGILGSLLLPTLAGRFYDQRKIVLTTTLLEIAGIVGLIVSGNQSVAVWIGLLGFALGANFGIALLLIVLRTDSTELTTGLSGLAQSVGYFVASFGPVVFGIIHDYTLRWNIPLYSMIVIASLQLMAGLGAARPKTISG